MMGEQRDLFGFEPVVRMRSRPSARIRRIWPRSCSDPGVVDSCSIQPSLAHDAGPSPACRDSRSHVGRSSLEARTAAHKARPRD